MKGRLALGHESRDLVRTCGLAPVHGLDIRGTDLEG